MWNKRFVDLEPDEWGLLILLIVLSISTGFLGVSHMRTRAIAENVQKTNVMLHSAKWLLMDQERDEIWLVQRDQWMEELNGL